MKRKMAAVVLVVCMSIGLFACGKGQENQEPPKQEGGTEGTETPSEGETPQGDVGETEGKKSYKIGFSQCVMNHPFRIAMVDSFKAVAENYEDVEIVVVEGNGDVQTEITNIESLIQQECDAIIVSSLSGTSIYPAYKEVQDAGIPLIIAASGCATEEEEAYNYYNSFVSTDEVEMGIAAAQCANELLNGEGNVVMIRGVVESTNSMNRYVGWNQEIPKYPGIKVVAEQAAEWLRLTANEVMANILQANKEIDLVYCENDEMALGALEAIRDAGREDEMVIVSMDGQPDACDEVLSGGAFKVTITNNSSMDEAVKAAYQLSTGGSVDKRIILPYEIVTEENVEEYIKNNFQ